MTRRRADWRDRARTYVEWFAHVFLFGALAWAAVRAAARGEWEWATLDVVLAAFLAGSLVQDVVTSPERRPWFDAVRMRTYVPTCFILLLALNLAWRNAIGDLHRGALGGCIINAAALTFVFVAIKSARASDDRGRE
jgi:hypothetical protein